MKHNNLAEIDRLLHILFANNQSVYTATLCNDIPKKTAINNKRRTNWIGLISKYPQRFKWQSYYSLKESMTKGQGVFGSIM